ncbi:hypothetical protein H8E88_30645 [candidate division KSB1 bacterium]|nr:hypothetical protein [candidate division KSB1 bacterium]MBL7095564.1 hypothetical protein [candidate division KSB1 bacterium]
MYLIRKINKAKWFQIDIMNDDDVTADAITNCLKTTENTLSVWNIENEADIEQAVLAIAASLQHIETIDVVILSTDTLKQYDINIITSTGNTPIESLKEIHRDLSGLTFSKLSQIKDHIVERIRNEKLKRFTKGQLKKLLLRSN